MNQYSINTMAHFTLSFVLASLLALATLHGTHAQEYSVVYRAGNTAGGLRWKNQLGAPYTLEKMRAATSYIHYLFKQTTDTKYVEKITLFIDDIDGVATTSRVGNSAEIHYSARYIQGVTTQLQPAFEGVLFHEMTHVWQWNGNGQANGGLIEGIADFVRNRAGYVDNTWVKNGQGDRWDQGYSVTMRFLNYCNNKRDDFVAELNKMMRYRYSDNYFQLLLGKTVDQLWSEYKRFYGQGL